MSTMTATRPLHPVGDHVPDYRLTRRGRLVVLLVGLLTLLAIGIAFAGVSLASEEPEPTETIVVASGDTLWGIASDLSDSGDVRSMMRQLQDLNSLDSASLAVGQQLQVPLG